MAEQFEPFFAAADGSPAATYPDLDMLCIGDVQHGGRLRPSAFTPSEARLLMTLWSFCGAPLIMGGALPPSSPDTLALLANPPTLRVHGAAHGRRVLRPGGGAEVHGWAAIPDEAPGEAYVALLNAADAPVNATLALAGLPWLPSGGVCATDLWAGGAAAGAFPNGVLFAVLAPHSAAALRLAAC